jgi:hypothetical protein
MCFKSGFLIVKAFNKLYEDYVVRYNLKSEVYAIPRLDRTPSDYKIKYRGIDRDSICGYATSDDLAGVRLFELEEEQRSQDDFVFEEQDAIDVLQYLDEEKEDYEIIWLRIINSGDTVPQGYKSIGFEPSYFYEDHYSAICDCTLIPRWHGTDKEGVIFREYFDKLNSYGLFDNASTAKDFLDYYLSFDWTEKGDFEIIEVFIKY